MRLHPDRFHAAIRLPLAALLLSIALGTAAAVEVERVPLTAIEYDTVWTTNGGSVQGSIIGTQADGAIRIERIGKSATLIPKNEIIRVERHQTLPEAVIRRGEQAIAAADWIDVQRILRFVLEKKEEAKPVAPPVEEPKAGDEAVKKPEPKPDTKKGPLIDIPALKEAGLEVARKALTTKPTTEVAALAMQLAWERGDTQAVLGFAQTGLTADPNWTPGYENQAKIFLEAKQDERMRALVKVWLERQPTAFEANRYMARLAEAAGDIKVATEAYRKGFDLHKDWESALGFARCSLKRGDRDECARAAKALIDANQFVAPAKIWLGSAMLKMGSPEAIAQAQVLLEAGLAGNPDEEATAVGRYNLGLLHQRAGRLDETRKLWSQVSGPMGQIAMAQLDRTPIPVAGAPAALAPLIAEHNACIELENKRWQNVLGGGLDLTASKRAVFLGQVAQVIKSGGAEDQLHNLAATPGEESQRWQAYGMIMQGRFKDAETLLDQLPVTDGWAIAVRVYIASARKDDAGARSWLKRLDGSVGAPRQYTQVLIAEFANANDEITREEFDWAEDDTVATGWAVAAPGTNVIVHAKAGKLVFEGSQLGSEPTAAYKLVASDRFRSVEAQFDTNGLGAAIGGLELTDEKRDNGLQFGINGGKVQWRAAEKGTWGNWQPAELPTVADGARLRIQLCLLYTSDAADDM
jgi:tetratricopeptide (TPR) repeat protein